MEGLQRSGIHTSYGCISKLGNRPPPKPQRAQPPPTILVQLHMALHHMIGSELRWRWSLKLSNTFWLWQLIFLTTFQGQKRTNTEKKIADRGSAVGKQRLDGVMYRVEGSWSKEMVRRSTVAAHFVQRHRRSQTLHFHFWYLFNFYLLSLTKTILARKFVSVNAV